MKNPAPYPHLFFLTGPIQGGKSSLAAELARVWKKQGGKAGGFLAPGLMQEGERTGFNLQRVSRDQQIPLARKTGPASWFTFRRFSFNPEAFRIGMHWLREDLQNGADLLIIDEVGPLELQGRGWRKVLDHFASVPELLQLWVVRKAVLEEFKKLWPVPEEQILDLQETQPEDVLLYLNRQWKKSDKRR